jgi:hypothetical protein
MLLWVAELTFDVSRPPHVEKTLRILIQPHFADATIGFLNP